MGVIFCLKPLVCVESERQFCSLRWFLGRAIVVIIGIWLLGHCYGSRKVVDPRAKGLISKSFRSSGVRDSGRWGGLGPTVGAEVVLLQSPIVQDQQWLAHHPPLFMVRRWCPSSLLAPSPWQLSSSFDHTCRLPTILLTTNYPYSLPSQQQQLIRARFLHFLQNQRSKVKTGECHGESLAKPILSTSWFFSSISLFAILGLKAKFDHWSATMITHQEQFSHFSWIVWACNRPSESPGRYIQSTNIHFSNWGKKHCLYSDFVSMASLDHWSCCTIWGRIDHKISWENKCSQLLEYTIPPPLLILIRPCRARLCAVHEGRRQGGPRQELPRLLNFSF